MNAAHKKSSLFKKYFWHILIFFVIAITSGVLMANYEARSLINWVTYTSIDAGLTFKHPQSFQVIEDQGWRITVYTDKQQTQNNIKILYTPKDPSAEDSGESQFLASCQPAKVNELIAQNARLKIYEDSNCGGQIIPLSIIVYSDNAMNYDINVFGEVDKTKLYTFLSTFTFE